VYQDHKVRKEDKAHRDLLVSTVLMVSMEQADQAEPVDQVVSMEQADQVVPVVVQAHLLVYQVQLVI
jgi:hypothetical protein